LFEPFSFKGEREQGAAIVKSEDLSQESGTFMAWSWKEMAAKRVLLSLNCKSCHKMGFWAEPELLSKVSLI